MLIQATTQTTEGHVYILSGNDDLNVAQGITITSTGTDAVTTWIGQHTVTVSGSIYAFDDCLNFIGTLDAQTVVIEATGQLISGYLPGIEDSDGVILDGINSTLTNHGSITSHGSALSLFVHDGGTTTITNTGTMSGEKYGIWNKFGAGVLTVTNTGTIESPTISYFGGNFVDNLTNAGLMDGAVNLGNGNDSYVGTGGQVIGTISGEGGDDWFVAGSLADQINGGIGIDTVDFSGAGTRIYVNLVDATANRGTLARYDTYAEVENLIGGNYADRLTGDAGYNHLQSGAGNDLIVGGAGDDTLLGGAGRDTLTGGTGADTFLFETLSGGRDVIVDFDIAADHLQFEGSGFGYGPYASAIDANVFVSGTGFKAIDADDRFIFRTTDATLWYDADGFGGIASLMIADLNAGVLLSYDDIIIV